MREIKDLVFGVLVALAAMALLGHSRSMAQDPGGDRGDRGGRFSRQDRGGPGDRSDRPDRGFRRGPGGPDNGSDQQGRRGPWNPGGPGDRPEGGDRGPRGGSMGSAEDRARRLESFIAGFDTNHNGVIEESEVEGRRGDFVRRMAERAGVEAKFPMPVDTLRKAMLEAANRRGGPAGPGGAPGNQPAGGENTASKTPPVEESKVPGFGPTQKASSVRGFGAEVAAAPAQATSPTSGQPASGAQPAPVASAQGPPDDRFRRLAQSMMQRMDKNGSGALERDEWADQQARLGPADANRDGTVTLDEMTAWLATYSRSGNRSDTRGSRDGGSRSDSSSDSGVSAGRKSYRFLTPTERLPEGLPDWFAQKDADGDGQVMMAEYTTVWSQSKVEEFSKYDLNADGIITPQECLKASR